MIPKTIHYCWFGRNPLPDEYKSYIESWKKYCPDYEIIEWNEDNFDISQNNYCREAYEAKKWAFVSDYARFDVLVKYGGFYLDTDVELLKPLDEFLELEAFSGFESETAIAAGLIACRKNFPLFKELLETYNRRNFIKPDGAYDISTIVALITNTVKEYGFIPNGKTQCIHELTLFPSDWFYPKNYFTEQTVITENTHAIHHYSASWFSPQQRYAHSLRTRYFNKKGKMPPRAYGIMIKIMTKLKYKHTKGER